MGKLGGCDRRALGDWNTHDDQILDSLYCDYNVQRLSVLTGRSHTNTISRHNRSRYL